MRYYFDCLLLKGNEKTVILPAGFNRIPFSYILPKNVPMTFRGIHGDVRYSCEAIIVRPWKLDEKTRTEFAVDGLLDLNAPEHRDLTVKILL